MKRTFAVAMLFLAIAFFPHALYSQHTDTKQDGRISGTFEWQAGNASGPVTARYLLKAATPDHIILHIMANGEFNVNARVIDRDGKELMKIDAAPVMPRYVNDINISKLVPGQYFVEVYGDKNEKTFRIPFTKG